MTTHGMRHEDRCLIAVVRPTGEVDPAWTKGPVSQDIVTATRYEYGADGWVFALDPVIKPRALAEGWKLAEPYFREAGMMEEFKYWMDINKKSVRSENGPEDIFHEYYVPEAIKADAAKRKEGTRLVAPKKRRKASAQAKTQPAIEQTREI